MDNEIVFVTHNIGKIKSAEKYFKNLKFTTFNYELDEPRSDDIKEIATAKVKQAYEIVKRPCIALDTDFRIEELNGFPRAFVNFKLLKYLSADFIFPVLCVTKTISLSILFFLHSIYYSLRWLYHKNFYLSTN